MKKSIEQAFEDFLKLEEEKVKKDTIEKENKQSDDEIDTGDCIQF